MVPSLDCFPEELLHSILCHCPPRSTAALEQTARRFRGVTTEPLLWRFYCLSHFKHWAQEHELPAKLASPISAVGWKSLYISRHLKYRATCHLLDNILANQTGRIDKIRKVIGFGYDAKDALLHNLEVECEVEDYLARRYYAEALLTCLHRSLAVREWDRLRNGEEVSIDRALGAFDLFIPRSNFGNLEDISNELDSVASLVSLNCPGIHQLTSRDKARAIAKFLRANNLTGINAEKKYHCLEHNFLGIALNDPGHNSLPLISATIYCSVARRVGLDARPCGFPFHVHVIIMPPIGHDVDGNAIEVGTQGSPIYMDPFRSERETPVENLEYQLNFLGATALEQATFLGESRLSEIVLRCSKNILNSVQHTAQFPNPCLAPVDVVGAKYAAIWSSMLLSDLARPTEIRHNLLWLMELFATEFPSDIHLIEQYVAPLLHGMPEYENILESLHVMRAVDEIPKQVKRRFSQRTKIKYHVGQVFRHRRYDYQAIITGWDTECGAGEQWMRRMGIDRLQGGRHQSFYHVL
ncbi:YccV-like-domain-containing protein [Aspergillus sclerotiicarbonarius CBS 121057]|uniref:YccV-like-domain-containing protein n=1 Tax=Aspergillus sclerotiicarbonarius (strain CBS 121057 / IBT 28362) TaxID=1448318 RepID=A0A319ETF9_ASPSB|nr:YccV-like-domain-containing protein [Aspergillus sclerotiicarbonarius CBS 121057]